MLRILIFGHLGQGNIGDELMFQSIVAALRQRFPEARLTVSAGGLYDRSFCEANQIRRIPRTFRRLLSSLLQHDMLVIAGGTHLHTCRTTSRYTKGVFRHLVIYRLARLAGLKVWLIGVGIGPFETRVGRVLGQAAARAAHFISARDEDSLAWLRRFAVPRDRLRMCRDPAYHLSLPSPRRSSPHLGISAMGYFGLYHRTPDRDESLARRFHDVIRNWFRVFPNSRVSLVAFYSSDDQESDVLLARRIQTEWSNDSRVHVVDPRGSVDRCVECFRYFTHVIAMRYHSQVLASLYGIPHVVIAYHGKNRSLAADRGGGLEDIIAVEDFAGGGGQAAIERLFRRSVVMPPIPSHVVGDELLPVHGSSEHESS